MAYSKKKKKKKTDWSIFGTRHRRPRLPSFPCHAFSQTFFEFSIGNFILP